MNINKEEYLQKLQASSKIVQSNVNAYFAKDGNANKTMDNYFESDDFYAIVDAINIDWNGIEVSENKTINTTTDLINWINEIATSIPKQGDSQEEPGTPGKDGKSAYEIAQETGFEGTETEWLESLKGVDGKDGVDGKSAYELYKETVDEQEAKPAIYSFKSFGVDDQAPYGTGTVKVIDIDEVEDSTTIEVLTNEPAGNTTPEQAEQFVGKQYIIHNTELINGNQYYLYSDSGLQTPICVTVKLVSEAQEAVVAMTETEWLESLKGKDGKDGVDGKDGKDGSFDESVLENYALKTDLDDKVSWVESSAERHHIVLKNHDTILGTASDNVSTYNLAMVSKWNVADFGSAQIHMNLNSIDGVTLNDDQHIATTEYVTQEIQKIVGAAPEALDTLQEIGEKLANNDDAVTALTNSIAAKANIENVYTKDEANAAFQPVGEYLTEQDISGKANVGDSYTKEESDNKYATKAELGTFGEETELEYEFINNAQNWQESYENGVLKKYYQKYPEEDLWNAVENRAVNFNDRYYHGNIGNEAIECGATWASERAQKLVINDVTYYAPIFYGMEGQDVELFNDIDLTDSTGQTFTIETVVYNGNCVHCWEGTVNSPGAKLPWVAISFEDDANVMIKFQYEGKDDVTPWNFTVFGAGEGHKAWGLASPASEFGDNDFAITENGGENAFDTSKFKVIGVSANVNIPAAIKAYIDMEIKKIKASL